MSTATRKLVYIDGDLVQTKEGSVDVNAGGLEGTEVMSESGFGGMERKQIPGRVKMEVIINGEQNEQWWNESIRRDILVEFVDVPSGVRGWSFTRMECKTVFESSGATAALEFVGPKGLPVK